MDTKTLAAVVAVAAIAAAATVLTAYFTIHSTGRIIGFGVTCSVDAIDWGDLGPGETAQAGFHVLNTGDRNGTLSMTADTPAYLTLTWDAEGAELQPKQSRFVLLTLEAAADAEPQDFSFDIVITLTGGEV